MLVKIVDASVLGALIFAEPEAENVANELSGARLIAPSLLHYELARIRRKKILNHSSKADKLMTAFRLAGKLSIETVTVEQVEVIELAIRTQLTTSDACYLWLAQKAYANLVTLDKRLNMAFAV